MQFIDLKAQQRALKAQIDAAVQAVLVHGQYILGPEVERFEHEFASYLGIKHAVTCANGTDALQMLYMAYGIGAGDAVFCSDITFIATVEPAVMLGATPVFCDISLTDFNLCPESLERQIEAVHKEGKFKPKAILAVDFLGNPCDYVELSEIAKKYDLLLIEDAAQSFGAEVQDKKCGAFGDAAATSFFPAKPLGCYGDGGAVMTNDDEIAALCRSIRVHGKGTNKYENVRVGMNSRLDTLQAAVLLVKLEAFKAYEMDARQRIAARYDAAFDGKFSLQHVADVNRSAYAQYAMLADDTAQRDVVIQRLGEKGIPTMIYYPRPQHELEAFAGINGYGEAFENANAYCARTFSIPMHPYLESGIQDVIIGAVLEGI